ncbi:FHA domain-containing protein [Kitasatospora phosalacinea]|uniref:FHA domain-containing protein n=2 Tax=Kitasatospora phosalacinea TaxID=2065 RepID=A0ABW6GSC4_9ACTN
MPICPRGHESQAEDWCDYCGFPMTPPPGLAIPGFPNGPAQPGAQGHPGAQAHPGGPAAPPPGPPGPPPYTSSGYPPVGPGPGSTPPSGTPAGGGGYFEPRRTPTPPAGTPTGPAAGAPGVPGAPGPYGAPPPPPPTTGLVNCPICRSPQTGRYCEECGYDYNLATSARPPGAAPGPLGHQPPPAPPQGQRPPQQGYGFPPPAAAPPAAPPAFDPPAPPPYEQRPPQPQSPSPYEQQRAPYEQPQQQPHAPQPHAPQSPYEQRPPQQQPQPPYEQRPGFPAAQAAGAAPAAPAPSFEKPPAAGFPDIDYERTGPVYPEPSAPAPGHQPPQQQPPQSGGDSGTSFRLTPPGQQPGGAPQQRATWYAVVAPDHEYFTDMMTRSGPEAAGLYFPQYTSERRVPLTGRGQLRIGRRSQQRGTVPEIDLSVSPEDPGASHHHALLAEQPDGSWVVVDQDSTNGTTMNGSPETLPPHTAIPLNDGDRIHVGAWTTITVHLA